MTNHYLMWQLIDSALPTGALSHSGGLESWTQAMGKADISVAVESLLYQALAQQLPLVLRAYQLPKLIAVHDQACHALLTNHVAQRASIGQGRALLSVLERVFAELGFDQLRQRIRMKELSGHFAPIFGWSQQALSIEQELCKQAYAFILLRGLFSSAIRLGICGPMEAQQLQQQLHLRLDAIIQRCNVDVAEQIHPIQDIVHGMHDRLYSRLFAS